MKAKKQKLNFKPTPISRLRSYKSPIKMVGDPAWGGYGRDAWANRERAVYQYEMERKSWVMAWEPEVWDIAQRDNERLDFHLRIKWDDYDDAVFDNKWLDYYDACRDNAAWDYHHEYAVDLEVARWRRPRETC